MKHLLKITFLLFVSCTAYSQNKYASQIKLQADFMAKALMSKDYSTLLNYTYPEVVKLGGGKEKLLATLKSALEGMAQQGYTIEKVTIGQPGKIFIAGKELHCLLSKTTVMNTPKGKINSTSYMLCISKNNGENWYFMESNKLSKENIKKIFPNFNSDLKIPETVVN